MYYFREPAVKRTICKRCQSPLIPGKTARVRLISKPTKAIKWTCLACGNNRKIPSKKGYKLWWDQPEAVKCVFDYASKKSQNESISAKEIKKETNTQLKEKEANDTLQKK